MFQLSSHFVTFPLGLLQFVNLFLVEDRKLDTVPHTQSLECQLKRKNHFPHPVGSSLANMSKDMTDFYFDGKVHC